jgi:glutamyl-tRNA reductase
MKLQMVGCSYHTVSVEHREKLVFDAEKAGLALGRLRERFPIAEAVLLSTCNRVEIYSAAENSSAVPTHEEVARFVAEFHGLPLAEVFDELHERTDEDAVRHLFTVAASLDSMVVGEPQILAQVKQAYELANRSGSTGPLTHSAFQAAVRLARRVQTETQVHQKRVSIPSIAVADFASQIFERFDGKQILVIGAGDMAEETLRYLQEAGGHQVAVVNRNIARARELAERWQGRAEPWERLPDLLTAADLVVSTTGANDPVIRLASFLKIEQHRYQRPLFILDLAIPRDFEPAIGERPGVYLYSIDDLQSACQRNRAERDRELPAAIHIVEQETARFMADLRHRATAPIIRRLKADWQSSKEDELRRLFGKLSHLDDRSRQEILQSFDRLINKLLHPPLESLRSEALSGPPHGLLEALKRLFHISD